MWILSSDLQLIGVLIAKYNLSNDRIRNNNQLMNCSPLGWLSGHLESSDMSPGSESYDSNTKMYPARI